MPKGGKRIGAGAKPRASSPSANRGVRFTDDEWEVVKQKAKADNITVSDYIRKKALE